MLWNAKFAKSCLYRILKAELSTYRHQLNIKPEKKNLPILRWLQGGIISWFTKDWLQLQKVSKTLKLSKISKNQ